MTISINKETYGKFPQLINDYKEGAMKIARITTAFLIVLVSTFAIADPDIYIGETTVKARGHNNMLPDESRVNVTMSLQCFKTPAAALAKLNGMKAKIIPVMEKYIKLDRDRYIARGPSIRPQTLFITKVVEVPVFDPNTGKPVIDEETGKQKTVKRDKRFPDPECTKLYSATETITLRKTVDFEDRYEKTIDGEPYTGFEKAGEIFKNLAKVIVTNKDKVEGVTARIHSQHILSEDARKFAEAKAEEKAEDHYNAQLPGRIKRCGMEKYWVIRDVTGSPQYSGQIPPAAYDKALGLAEEGVGGQETAPLVSPEEITVSTTIAITLKYHSAQRTCAVPLK